MSKKVVIASACRTAVGSMGGQLSTVPAAEMGRSSGSYPERGLRFWSECCKRSSRYDPCRRC